MAFVVRLQTRVFRQMKREIMIKAVQAASASNNAEGLEVHKALSGNNDQNNALFEVHHTHTHIDTPTTVLLQIVTQRRLFNYFLFISGGGGGGVGGASQTSRILLPCKRSCLPD